MIHSKRYNFLSMSIRFSKVVSIVKDSRINKVSNVKEIMRNSCEKRNKQQEDVLIESF